VAIGLAPRRPSRGTSSPYVPARRRPPTHLLDRPHWATLRSLEVARSHGSCPGRPRSPVTGVVPAGAHSHRWRLGFKQSSLGHIARILRHPAMDASRRPPLHRHALVPFRFPIQVSRSIQEQILQVPPNCVGDTGEAPHGAHPPCPFPSTGRSTCPVVDRVVILILRPATELGSLSPGSGSVSCEPSPG
jgi:hypothetical protein